MQWYQDSVHVSRRTGRAIVDAVLGFPPSELAKDQTFGVQPTPANIDEYFERRRIERERYLAANPEIEADCRALSGQGGAARPARFSRQTTQAVRGNAGNGRDQNAMTMSKSVTL
jgi:hypothetical protein